MVCMFVAFLSLFDDVIAKCPILIPYLIRFLNRFYIGSLLCTNNRDVGEWLNWISILLILSRHV